MRPDIQVLLSGALTFGVPLLLAVRELFVLNRDPAPPAAGDDPDSEPSPPLLPPCPMLEARELTPMAPAARTRALEPV
jgi:hypothetical protein